MTQNTPSGRTSFVNQSIAGSRHMDEIVDDELLRALEDEDSDPEVGHLQKACISLVHSLSTKLVSSISRLRYNQSRDACCGRPALSLRHLC